MVLLRTADEFDVVRLLADAQDLTAILDAFEAE